MWEAHDIYNTNFKRPLFGFLLSLLLTFGAYMLTVKTKIPHSLFLFLMATIAATQCMIQLILFLNLGSESKPRWGLMTSLFTLVVILIIIGGSVWIMYTLNYNLMPKM